MGSALLHTPDTPTSGGPGLISSTNTPCEGSVPHLVRVGDVNRLTATVDRHHDGYPEGNLGCGYGYDKDRKYLSGQQKPRRILGHFNTTCKPCWNDVT